MSINNDTLLKSLAFFPIAGYIVKYWVLDVATANMGAVSSIILDSCMVLYLACIIGFLSSKLNTPESTMPLKFGIGVIALLAGVYIASLILNSQYIDLINNGKVELTSDSFWIFSEICILMTYVSAFLSNSDASTWLLFLFILIMPHTIVIFNNFVNVRTRPTDDAKQNINGPTTYWIITRAERFEEWNCWTRCALTTRICRGLAKNWWARRSRRDICRDKSPAWLNQLRDETAVSIPVLRHRVSWLAGTGQLSSLASFLSLLCLFCLFCLFWLFCLFCLLFIVEYFLYHCAKKYTSFLRVYFL